MPDLGERGDQRWPALRMAAGALAWSVATPPQLARELDRVVAAAHLAGEARGFDLA
jgi:hypothetical protein